jgi:glycosyltransferase involved in cell wall biosynthesis
MAVPAVPKVSVVMSVFNAEPYLGEAIESILNQSFRDFELVIVDDASTDHSWETLSSYAERDARIVPLRNPSNVGVVRSLNSGLDQSKGVIIVRQDADDISHPERIQRQLAFLDAHPDYGMVGAVPQVIDSDGTPLNLSGWNATANEEIQRKLLDYMCLCGPSIMVRRECLEAAGFYFSMGLDASEDYDICLRLAEVTKLASLGGSLYRYRQHPNSASSKRAQQQMVNKAIALERAMDRRYGPNPPHDQVATVARDYLHAAVIGYARNDLTAARRCLTRALEVYPSLLDKNEPLETLVRAYTPVQSTQEALAYTESIFENLLPHSRHLSRLRSRLLSYLHMSEVFAGAQQRQPWRTQSHLWSGIRHDQSWLFNRGVISILVKSLFRRDSRRETDKLDADIPTPRTG